MVDTFQLTPVSLEARQIVAAKEVEEDGDREEEARWRRDEGMKLTTDIARRAVRPNGGTSTCESGSAKESFWWKKRRRNSD